MPRRSSRVQKHQNKILATGIFFIILTLQNFINFFAQSYRKSCKLIDYVTHLSRHCVNLLLCIPVSLQSDLQYETHEQDCTNILDGNIQIDRYFIDINLIYKCLVCSICNGPILTHLNFKIMEYQIIFFLHKNYLKYWVFTVKLYT